MRKFKLFALALLCAVSAIFMGCPKDPVTVTEEFGVEIKLPGKTDRTVFYDASEVATYQIDVTQNGYNVTSKTAAPGNTVKIKLEDYGNYEINVTGKNEAGREIASGTASVSFSEGDGYKTVTIDIEPYKKDIGIYAMAIWEDEQDGYFTSSDAVRYDVTIYEDDEEVAVYENANVFNTTRTIYISYYGTYTIKIEAKKANLNVVGSGETTFTLSKGDTFKNVTVTIEAEAKETSGGGEASAFGVNANMNWVEGYRREKVEFGEWPQTLAYVTGLTLEETGKTYDGHTEYSADDGNRYVEVNDSYYKVEPMTWRIIAYNSDGSKKLLADKIYTNLAYYGTFSGTRTLGSKTIYPNNYKYSNVRAYLNSINNQFVTDGGTATEYDVDWTNAGFLTSAFTEEEKAKIKTTVVDNSAATTDSSTNQYACENTNDKIYLLSYADARKSLYGLGSYNDRIMMTTDYARANGAYQSSTEGYGGYWWLRSPSYNGSSYARSVINDGDLSRSNVSGSFNGVVPALSVTE